MDRLTAAQTAAFIFTYSVYRTIISNRNQHNRTPRHHVSPLHNYSMAGFEQLSFDTTHIESCFLIFICLKMLHFLLLSGYCITISCAHNIDIKAGPILKTHTTASYFGFSATGVIIDNSTKPWLVYLQVFIYMQCPTL